MSDSILASFDVSASGLAAQSARMDVIAQNIANSQTTRTAAGQPYRRRQICFRADIENALGVSIDGIMEDPSPFKTILDKGHPDADAEGYVRMPNVNIPLEMVDMVSASRAYQANLAVMKNFQEMANSALDLLR